MSREVDARARGCDGERERERDDEVRDDARRAREEGARVDGSIRADYVLESPSRLFRDARGAQSRLE